MGNNKFEGVRMDRNSPMRQNPATEDCSTKAPPPAKGATTITYGVFTGTSTNNDGGNSLWNNGGQFGGQVSGKGGVRGGGFTTPAEDGSSNSDNHRRSTFGEVNSWGGIRGGRGSRGGRDSARCLSSDASDTGPEKGSEPNGNDNDSGSSRNRENVIEGRGDRSTIDGGSDGFSNSFPDASNDDNLDENHNAGPKVTYVPPPPPEDETSIFSQFQKGVNFDKFDNIQVEVRGRDPPPAIMSFEEAGLCPNLSRNITKSGYKKPTPVQKHSIPIVSTGRDLLACAQTGSGKTAAFLLPILQTLMSDGVTADGFKQIQEPEVIIVAPTRELINQIYLDARKFSYGGCLRPVVVYGGISSAYAIREVMRGCNVLCGTPGRLMDIIGRGKVGVRKLRYLVLDEADQMLDMGFEPAIRSLVGSPGMPPKEERQTLLFSATYPEDIQRLAADFLRTDYIFLAVGQVGGACCDVEQSVIQVTQFSKRDQLVELLQTTGPERTLVFVGSRKKADFIATFLSQVKIPTTSIHGDREQQEREVALHDFRSGKYPVLVATSVAARGLDIEHVQHVVNFDLPSGIDEYVQRIGRTGRCGNTGRAVSFFEPDADTPLAHSLVKVLEGVFTCCFI
ncbi:ATP-dependent RNA helicase DDX4-like isoform X3 [Hypomesus transpacificus]|uniref:ATP-dependent RNA helicase DDX4-like isoform X3 n=1 Tax=Hypomesus transpacificus TaxID=137520 RepID=UPI001F07FF6E|nr:ATP-dependent RNA helicase DDX4-like isoform X3 [Hypomesus transpacificus]